MTLHGNLQLSTHAEEVGDLNDSMECVLPWRPGRVEPTVGYTLLDIVDQRMQTGSLIITSQFPTEHWHSMFSDATLAEAILDRIVHRSHRIGLKGESLRKQAAKA